MGSSTGSLILLGLVAGVAVLASAENIQQSDGQSINQNNGNTFLSNGVGQIFRRSDGKTVMIGADGRLIATDSADEDVSLDDDSSRGGNYNSNNIIINGEQSSSIFQRDGQSFIYGNGNQGTYISGNGRSVRVIDGGIVLTENGQDYTFRSKARTANEKETVTINGQPAQVEYSNGDVVVELADHTVVAKVGNRTFLGDRNSFDNRDQLEAEAKNHALRVQQEAQEHIEKTMADLNARLRNTFSKFPFV